MRARHSRSHERFPISDMTDILGFKETSRERGRICVWNIDSKYRWLSARSTPAACRSKEKKKREKKHKIKERKEKRVKDCSRRRERKSFQGYWLIALAECIEARLLAYRIANELRRIDWMHRSVSRQAEHFEKKNSVTACNEILLHVYIEQVFNFGVLITDCDKKTEK